MRPLTPKQLKFIERYLATGNATQAYVDAGYRARGKSAGNSASRLLENDGIKAAIVGHRAAAEKSCGLTAEWVLREMQKIASLDPRRMFHPDGTRKQIHELDDDTAACIAGLEIEEITKPGLTEPLTTRTVKVKCWDKRLAIQDLGKYFKLWDGEGKVGVHVNVNVQPVDRIDQLTDAFEGAASRAGESPVPGNGAGKPVDSRAGQDGSLPQAG